MCRLSNDKSLKDKDMMSERKSLGQLIMEEEISSMDKVPKVEPKFETEAEMRSNIAEENGKYSLT